MDIDGQSMLTNFFEAASLTVFDHKAIITLVNTLQSNICTTSESYDIARIFRSYPVAFGCLTYSPTLPMMQTGS